MARFVAVRDAIADALVAEGARNEDILVLDADLATSTQVSRFAAAYPDRFIQVGVAEQNMIGMAAGLASLGFIPFTSTFACFAAKRAADQVRQSVAQPRANVKMIGAYVGLFTGKTGKTHQAVQDMAVMRAMPNMTVIEPGDGVEAGQAVAAVLDHGGPVYLRVARDPSPVFYEPGHRFRIGGSIRLRDGGDVAVFSVGTMTALALEAADLLRDRGIRATVVHLCSVKPIDSETIVDAARGTGAAVTVENHSIIGGLGSAVMEVLGESCPVPVRRVGIRDVFGESGSNEALAAKYGLTAEAVARAAEDVIAR